MDAAGLLADEARVEEHLRATEALAANGDDVATRDIVSLSLVLALRCSLHLAVEVQRDVGQLLLGIVHDLVFRSGREEGAAQGLHHVLSKVAAGEIHTQDGVRQSIALVDRQRCATHRRQNP